MVKKNQQNIDGDKNKIQWWKIALCVLGVLVIAGVVTYTLMTRTSASSTATATSSPTAINPTPTATAANTPASDGSGELNWVKSLDSKWETNDFIFVVFPGNDDLTRNADQAVKSALVKLRENGAAVDAMTLSSTDPEFRPTLERLAIQKLPAVLILQVTGQGGVIKGDITETKLLQAYLTMQKTCAPGAGSGCCP